MSLRLARDTDLPAVVGLQHAAYARNRALLGVEPLPLIADYAEIFRTMEVWLHEVGAALSGGLILAPHPEHMLIWSIATNPSVQGSGVGKQLFRFAEERARQSGLDTMRLYTGTKLAHLIAGYGRHGFVTERIEELPDRSITHMIKQLPSQ